MQFGGGIAIHLQLPGIHFFSDRRSGRGSVSPQGHQNDLPSFIELRELGNDKSDAIVGRAGCFRRGGNTYEESIESVGEVDDEESGDGHALKSTCTKL